MKLLYWGIRVVFVLALSFILYDLYLLFLYPVNETSIQLLRSDNSQIQAWLHDKIPEIHTRWLNRDDSPEAKMFHQLERTFKTWKEYEKRAGLEGNPGFTYLLKDPVYQIPPLTEEERNSFETNWLSIQPEACLGFPRPTVTEADIELVENTSAKEFFKNPFHQPAWMNMVMGQKLSGELKDPKQSIQFAKDTTQNYERYVVFQKMCANLSYLYPKSKYPALYEANGQWIQRWMDAVNPNPAGESIFDLVVLTAMGEDLYKGIVGQIKNKNQIETYHDALTTFTQIEYDRSTYFFNAFPLDQPYQFKKRHLKDNLAVAFSKVRLFQWQCSLMQWFFPSTSHAYLRFELLKCGSWIIEPVISFPNFKNAQVRLNIVLAHQAICKTALGIAANDPLDFIHIPDPFSSSPIQIESSKENTTIRSTGPNGTIDGMLYDPSNGTDSRGDLFFQLATE